MPHQLIETGSVVLITGATGAIGGEIAIQAAREGATVLVHGSSQTNCDRAVAALRGRCDKGDFESLPADFSEPGAASKLIASALARHQRLDALIHCATGGATNESNPRVTGPLSVTDPRDYAALLTYGVAVLEELCHAALPALQESRGAIVAFASDSGLFAAPRQSLVGARMAAILAFVRNLGVETARDGVRINAISLSFVSNTPTFDRYHSAAGSRAESSLKRAGLGLPSPEDIAPLALFLAGPLSSKMTGQIISINGGLNA